VVVFVVVAQTEMNAKSLPTDTLSPVSVSWCQRVGSRAKSLSEARVDRVVLDAVQRSIDRVNENAISHAQHIQKWSILPRDFSVTGGELGNCSSNCSCSSSCSGCSSQREHH